MELVLVIHYYPGITCYPGISIPGIQVFQYLVSRYFNTCYPGISIPAIQVFQYLLSRYPGITFCPGFPRHFEIMFYTILVTYGPESLLVWLNPALRSPPWMCCDCHPSSWLICGCTVYSPVMYHSCRSHILLPKILICNLPGYIQLGSRQTVWLNVSTLLTNPVVWYIQSLWDVLLG